MVLALCSQLVMLPYGGWIKALKILIKSTATNTVGKDGENVKEKEFSSPIQNYDAGGLGVEGKDIEMIETKA